MEEKVIIEVAKGEEGKFQTIGEALERAKEEALKYNKKMYFIN